MKGLQHSCCHSKSRGKLESRSADGKYDLVCTSLTMRYQVKNGFGGVRGRGPSRWQLPERRPETVGRVELKDRDLRCLQRSLDGVCG